MRALLVFVAALAAIQALPQQEYTPGPGEFERMQAEVRRVAPLAVRPQLKPLLVIDQRPSLKRR